MFKLVSTATLPFSVKTNKCIRIGKFYVLTYFNKISANSFRLVSSITFKPDFENFEP